MTTDLGDFQCDVSRFATQTGDVLRAVFDDNLRDASSIAVEALAELGYEIEEPAAGPVPDNPGKLDEW